MRRRRNAPETQWVSLDWTIPSGKRNGGLSWPVGTGGTVSPQEAPRFGFLRMQAAPANAGAQIIVASQPITLLASHFVGHLVKDSGAITLVPGWMALGLAPMPQVNPATEFDPETFAKIGDGVVPGDWPLVVPALVTSNLSIAYVGSSRGKRRLKAGDALYVSRSADSSPTSSQTGVARLLFKVD